MGFKDKYTTTDLIAVDKLIDKDSKEDSKFIISNDAYALGEMMELLSNRLVR